MSELSYVGRRVLAHLPVWAEDEAAHIEAEGGPEESVRAYSLPDLTSRLLEDGATPNMAEDVVATILEELAGAGLCEETADGWKMTQLGFEVLTDPTPPENQTPGPAFIDLQPARIETNASAE